MRGVAFPDAPRPGYAVIVDLLVNDAIRQQLRRETGVELKSVTAVPPKSRPTRGRWAGATGGDDGTRGAAGASRRCSAT